MNVTRLGDWFDITCLGCNKNLGSLRAIIAGDHPAERAEALGSVGCPDCGQRTGFIKMPGEPPIFMTEELFQLHINAVEEKEGDGQ